MTALACASLSPTSTLMPKFFAKSPILNVEIPILMVVAVTPGPTGPALVGPVVVPPVEPPVLVVPVDVPPVVPPPLLGAAVAARALGGSLPSLTSFSICFGLSGLPLASVGTGTDGATVGAEVASSALSSTPGF